VCSSSASWLLSHDTDKDEIKRNLAANVAAACKYLVCSTYAACCMRLIGVMFCAAALLIPGHAFANMPEDLLELVKAPEGPRGGGRDCKQFKVAMGMQRVYYAMSFLYTFVHSCGVFVDRGYGHECLEFSKSFSWAMQGDNGPTLGIEQAFKYPAIFIDYWAVGLQNPDARRLMIAAHRFMNWWLRGPSPPGQTDVHHVCNNPKCVNPLHLKWIHPKQNSKENGLDVLKSKRATSQERSPTSGRFKKSKKSGSSSGGAWCCQQQ
jgi:hypothetical protein